MIIDDAAQLEQLASEVIALRQSQQHNQSLVHRKQLVDPMLERIVGASTSGNALAARLGDTRQPSPLFEQALSAIERWRSALDANLGQALSGDLFGALQDSLERAVREVERRATAAWQRYVAQQVPTISDEVLATLEADPRARPTATRIRHLTETLRRLRDRPLPTLAELGEFDVATVELRRAWASVDLADLNQEIVAFLRAANSDRGAPLDLLTEPVLTWLTERGATNNYVIRPAAE